MVTVIGGILGFKVDGAVTADLDTHGLNIFFADLDTHGLNIFYADKLGLPKGRSLTIMWLGGNSPELLFGCS